jgi:glycosyltransferase involved in cell wall biosynthesis
MKLLFIANSRIPTERAMGTAIMKQCEAFAKKDVSVELVVPRRKNVHTDNPFAYHQVEKNFTITYIWSLDFPALEHLGLRFFIQKVSFFIGLFFYVLKSDADVLYTREPELIGMLATDKDRFVELHHLYGLGVLGRFFLSKCTGIITITRALKDDVVRAFTIPPGKIRVAPSGVDLDAFTNVVSRDIAQKELNITTEKPVAMYIGALEEWKGYLTFLKAEKFLDEKITLVVIGGSHDQVEKLRAEYPKILFLGALPQRDLPVNQQAANILIVPNSAQELISARHTSPLKVFAHMTSGVPIVASAVESILEILSEKNAILVTPDDPHALAAGILSAIENTVHSDTIAQQAQKDVVQYDWDARTEFLYSFILNVIRPRSS